MSDSMDSTSICVACVDVVIAITTLEVVAFVGWELARGRSARARAALANCAAGLCLLGALRVTLAGAAWPGCLVFLAGAGAAHALDLWMRGPTSLWARLSTKRLP